MFSESSDDRHSMDTPESGTPELRPCISACHEKARLGIQHGWCATCYAEREAFWREENHALEQRLAQLTREHGPFIESAVWARLADASARRAIAAEAKVTALESQLAFIEAFADPPDMQTGKTTRDELRQQVASLTARLKEVEAQKDGAYVERNQLVALLSKLWPSHLAQHPHDPTWDKEWTTIVCVHAPFGQLSWHIHDSEWPRFAHLSEGPNDWDGHTTDEKYARIASCTSDQLQGDALKAFDFAYTAGRQDEAAKKHHQRPEPWGYAAQLAAFHREQQEASRGGTSREREKE